MPKPGAFDAMAQEEINQTVEVNLSAVLSLTRLLLPKMRARKSGHILFTGSSAAHAPGANFAVYAASKAAIAAFASALRAEVSPDGIRITELVPGRVETGLYAGVISDEARAAMYAGNAAVQPADVAAMLLAVLALPQSVDVARFDILPTHQGVATGTPKKEA